MSASDKSEGNASWGAPGIARRVPPQADDNRMRTPADLNVMIVNFIRIRAVLFGLLRSSWGRWDCLRLVWALQVSKVLRQREGEEIQRVPVFSADEDYRCGPGDGIERDVSIFAVRLDIKSWAQNVKQIRC
jgi:hypothetical protein